MADIKIIVGEIGKRREREVLLSSRATILDLLKLLGQNQETVVVRVNGKIITEEERLADGDLVEILPIVTGG